MKKTEIAIWMIAGALLMVITASAFAQGENREGQGKAVVTVLPKKHSEQAPTISLQDLNIKVNGKESNVSRWVPLREQNDKLELVVLIDCSARNLNGSHLAEIARFIESMPTQVKVAVGYMQAGNSLLATPLSTDHAKAASGLHMTQGQSTGPYYSLSNLAKNWPSTERDIRREVLMITSGVNPFNQNYDSNDPNLQAAITDSVRAGLIVYSIYWSSGNSSGISSDQDQDQTMGSTGHVRGLSSTNAGSFQNEDGQSLLILVSKATGGKNYGNAGSTPVTIKPYLEDIAVRLKNQYELGFTAQLNGKSSIENLKLKARGLSSEIDTPEKVFVGQAAVAAQ
jgi:hypothetical protein